MICLNHTMKGTVGDTMTKEEALIISAYTGYLLVSDFSEVHNFCEQTLGRPIFTHEFADHNFQEKIKEKLHPKIKEIVENGVSEWVEYDGEDAGLHYCKKCKQQAFNFDEERELVEVLSNFCPFCGRQMKKQLGGGAK